MIRSSRFDGGGGGREEAKSVVVFFGGEKRKKKKKMGGVVVWYQVWVQAKLVCAQPPPLGWGVCVYRRCWIWGLMGGCALVDT